MNPAGPMAARLHHLPDAFHTARLTVRAPRPGDGLAVFQAVAESLEELRAWPAHLPWAMQEPSPDASEAFCRHGQAAFLAREDFPMLIFLKGQEILVGATGLHRLDERTARCEVGYWVRTSHARQGFITEAVEGITRFAFRHLGVRRLECLTDSANQASRAVAERAGYTLVGIKRHERLGPDGPSPETCAETCVYAVEP